MVSSKVVKIKPGDVVRVWGVDDVGTLTIGGFSMAVAGHNNYDETGRWTGYTYGEGTAVYQGPAGLFRGTLTVVNSLGGPGASGQWSAGEAVSGQGLVLIKSVDKIVRYEEEHAYCKEVSNPTMFPARGGTRTARYIPYVTQTPVYQKENTYKDEDTGETVVKIEGDEEVRSAEAKVVALSGVNVSLTVLENTSGIQQTHTMYTCPDCGLVITGTQEADDSEGDWVSVGTHEKPLGDTTEHIGCVATPLPNSISNDGGSGTVSIIENIRITPTFEVYEDFINTSTGASRSVLVGTRLDKNSATKGTTTKSVPYTVSANPTENPRSVSVYTCALCGETAAVLQHEDGDPGIGGGGEGGGGGTETPPTPEDNHRCAGGVYFNEEPCESFAKGAENITSIKVGETHKHIR